MLLEIISPEETVYKGEVVMVQMPGTMGSFEILHNHAPLMATLEDGEVKVIDHERNKFFIPIKGGVVKVKDNKIVLLTR